MKLDRNILDTYLDGQMAPADQARVDQELQADPAAAALLVQLRRERALRYVALKSYEPTPREAAQLAACWLADFSDAAMAPIARIGALTVRQWATAVAAGLLVLVGSFVAGRNSIHPVVATAGIKYIMPSPNGELVEYKSVEDVKTAWDRYVAVVQNQNSSVQVADADILPSHGNF